MKRILLALFMLVFVVLFAPLAGAAWLTGTEQGLQFAVNKTQSWLGNNTTQELEVGKVQGTFWHGVQFDSLRWQNGETVVQAEQLQFQPDWAELLQRNLVIRNLAGESHLHSLVLY